MIPTCVAMYAGKQVDNQQNTLRKLQPYNLQILTCNLLTQTYKKQVYVKLHFKGSIRQFVCIKYIEQYDIILVWVKWRTVCA